MSFVRRKKTNDRDINAVISALDELDARQKNDLESRLAQIHELVGTAAYRCRNSDDALEFLRKAFPAEDCRDPISAYEQIALCDEYLTAFPYSAEFRRELFFGSSEPYRDEASGRIEYIGNNYTDEAFRCFSDKLGIKNALIVSSFEELCEDVYSGNSEYGILPVENTDNGKLLRFYSLINRYDLKIISVCSVSTSDSGSTSFALIRKSIEYPNVNFDKPDMLEFLVKPGRNGSLLQILTAARFCSMDIYRIDSLPLSSIDEEFTFCFVMKLNRESRIDPFLLYMSVDFPQYTPLGIFKYIF